MAQAQHEDYQFEILSEFSRYREQRLRQLREDLARHRIGGIVAIAPISHWPEVKQIFLDHPEVPVVLSDELPAGSKFIPLQFNQDGFIHQAFAEFQARNIHRVAVILMDAQKETDPMRQIAAGYGVEIPSYLWQHIHDLCRDSVTNLVELMLQLPQLRRPEAILIWDDNLLEHLGRGLEGRMAEFPDFPLVISHANFPNDNRYPFAVKLLGYDLKMFFKLAVARMRQWDDRYDNTPIMIEPEWQKQNMELI